MQDNKRPSSTRQAFNHYLRTGQRLAPSDNDGTQGVEVKFNPYHDPRDGRFTFAPGGPRSLAKVVIADRRKPPATAGAPNRLARFPRTALSRVQNDRLSQVEKFPPRPGTVSDWTEARKRGMAKAIFKEQYIAGHAKAFRAAAARYDLPVEMVASVAHVELGSDDAMNDIAYALRAEGGRDIPPVLGITKDGRKLVAGLNPPRAETSFGPYNIQQRRAAEILGYGDINAMSETARRSLVPTTREPVAATFMLAKHLSDLRDQDFPGVSGVALTEKQMNIIATRYNIGSEKDIDYIKSKISTGEKYMKMYNYVSKFFIR